MEDNISTALRSVALQIEEWRGELEAGRVPTTISMRVAEADLLRALRSYMAEPPVASKRPRWMGDTENDREDAREEFEDITT